jgi:hypothetical protein
MPRTHLRQNPGHYQMTGHSQDHPPLGCPWWPAKYPSVQHVHPGDDRCKSSSAMKKSNRNTKFLSLLLYNKTKKKKITCASSTFSAASVAMLEVNCTTSSYARVKNRSNNKYKPDDRLGVNINECDTCTGYKKYGTWKRKLSLFENK